MQRIERARHKAEMFETAAGCGGQAHHEECALLARHWRCCAAHLMLLYETSQFERPPRAGEPE